MSGVSVIGFEIGPGLASALGALLGIDAAQAEARDHRIRQLAAQRHARQVYADQVEAAALADRERRARQRVGARVDAATIAAAVAAAGLPAEPDLAQPQPGAPDRAWDAWCDGLDRARSSILARVAAAQHAAGAKLLAGALTTEAAAELAVVGAGATPPHRDAAAAVVDRMLATLDPLASESDRARAHAAAARMLRVPDEPGARVQLRVLVQDANQRARARLEDAVTAAQLLDAIEPYAAARGLDPVRLEAVRAALADVVAGARSLDPALLDEVENLRASVESSASAMAVADAFVAVLTDLGYDVGSDFSLVEPAAGMLEITHPHRPAHLVRVRVDDRSTSLVATVLRTDEQDDPDSDAYAESAWCASLDEALARLTDSGMRLTATTVSPPGQRPVARSAPAGVRRANRVAPSERARARDPRDAS